MSRRRTKSWQQFDSECRHAFDALQARWDQTAATDDVERQRIIDELRELTRTWMAYVQARHGTPPGGESSP